MSPCSGAWSASSAGNALRCHGDDPRSQSWTLPPIPPTGGFQSGPTSRGRSTAGPLVVWAVSAASGSCGVFISLSCRSPAVSALWRCAENQQRVAKRGDATFRQGNTTGLERGAARQNRTNAARCGTSIRFGAGCLSMLFRLRPGRCHETAEQGDGPQRQAVARFGWIQRSFSGLPWVIADVTRQERARLVRCVC